MTGSEFTVSALSSRERLLSPENRGRWPCGPAMCLPQNRFLKVSELLLCQKVCCYCVLYYI